MASTWMDVDSRARTSSHACSGSRFAGRVPAVGTFRRADKLRSQDHTSAVFQTNRTRIEYAITLNMHIDFALWNTGLAPPSTGSSPTSDHEGLVKSALLTLCERGCSIIALTEMRRRDPVDLLPDSVATRWACIRDESEERHDFDLALLFDQEQILSLRSTFLVEFYAGRRVRCGLLSVLALPDSAILILVLVHWRSDLGGHEDASAQRSRSADAIKVAISQALEEFGADAHVLVVGDFNVEPFDETFNVLPTARFRDVVRRHKPRGRGDVLLYNTSWRWMGESEPWAGQSIPSNAGTFFSRRNSPHAWRTFDQVLVSASLLRETGWTLMESSTKTLIPDEIFDAQRGRLKKPLDHVPIVGQLAYLKGQ